MSRQAATAVLAGARGWRQGHPLLRVMPTWLMVAVLVLPALGFWLGIGLHPRSASMVSVLATAVPQAGPVSLKSVGMRRLRFVDAPDKSVQVLDADTGVEVYRVVGEAGFIRGILRGMARERRRLGKGPEEPFELSLDAGLLTLRDLATGGHVELTAFGPTNAGAFARMLLEPPPAQLAASLAGHPR